VLQHDEGGDVSRRGAKKSRCRIDRNLKWGKVGLHKNSQIMWDRAGAADGMKMSAHDGALFRKRSRGREIHSKGANRRQRGKDAPWFHRSRDSVHRREGVAGGTKPDRGVGCRPTYEPGWGNISLKSWVGGG